MASATSSRPLPASSPTESRPTRGRSTPSTAALKAAPRKANWTRCWARTSTLAPTSRKSTGLAGDGELHGQGRALHALQPPQAEGRRGHRRPGRAGADHRLGPALGDVGDGAHDGGLLPGADRGNRILVVADPLRGGDDLDPVGAVEPELLGRAEDAQTDPVGCCKARALGEHVEALLGPEAIQGHGRAGTQALLRVGGSRGRLGDLVLDHLAPGVGTAGRADPVRQARTVTARAAAEGGPCLPCGWPGACRGGRSRFSSSGRP